MPTVDGNDNVAVAVPGEDCVEHDNLPFGVGEVEVARVNLYKGGGILDEAATEIGHSGVGHIDGTVGVVGIGSQILGFECPSSEVGGACQVGTVDDDFGVTVIIGGIAGEVGGGLGADGGIGCYVGVLTDGGAERCAVAPTACIGTRTDGSDINVV